MNFFRNLLDREGKTESRLDDPRSVHRLINDVSRADGFLIGFLINSDNFKSVHNSKRTAHIMNLQSSTLL